MAPFRPVSSCIDLLKQGRVLLADLPDEVLNAYPFHRSRGHVGSHFRHCIDFFFCLERGFACRRIDFDDRPRERRMEDDRKALIAGIERSIAWLESLSVEHLSVPLMVLVDRAEREDENGCWCESTLKRELRFLVNHTIHHYALVGVMLEQQGFETPPGFGLAPSTMRFRRENPPGSR